MIHPLVVRPARTEDVPALLALAKESGGGLTNLPADEAALAKRVAASEACLAAPPNTPDHYLILLVLERLPERRIVGTASLFTRVGTEWPFYSYRIMKLSQTSKELGKTLKSDVLHLVNDYDGCSEVGGLFVDPVARPSGAGRLMARSRYLFIAGHRARFADRIIAEMRGYAEADGRRPFWEGLGRHFFDMEFFDADRFNSLTGNQFIADLMPKYPIYVRLLPEDAQAAVGRCHTNSLPALKLLEQEGFRHQGTLDIFDGGPTVACETDDLRLFREQHIGPLHVGKPSDGATRMMLATGSEAHFRASACAATVQGDGCVTIPAEIADALGLAPGEEVRCAPL
jgi:arginine N-succinyltransferase